MMNNFFKVKKTAPLRNVAAFSTLVKTMVERDGDLPGLACFSGYSGAGKTESATYAATRYRARYVECGMYTSARDLMGSILMELGDHKPRGTIEQMKTRVIEIMAGDPRRPVIVDEAHFIASKRFVDLLREISDKSGAPVILVGEENLPTLLEQFDRVYSRVLEWLEAMPCDVEDFALLVRSRCPDLVIAPDLASAILEKTGGNTRFIAVNLTKVNEIASINGVGTVDLAMFGGPDQIRRLRGKRQAKGGRR